MRTAPSVFCVTRTNKVGGACFHSDASPRVNNLAASESSTHVFLAFNLNISKTFFFFATPSNFRFFHV